MTRNSNNRFDVIENIEVEFRSELGHIVRARTNVANLLTAIRAMGSTGCTPGAIPPGGFRFPLGAHDDFDWSLIGARPWTNKEGEEGLWYEGEFYKKRTLEAVDTKKMKMGEAIKYSRGARQTDPAEVREGDEAATQYVTLAIFRGDFKPNPRWRKPDPQQG